MKKLCFEFFVLFLGISMAFAGNCPAQQKIRISYFDVPPFVIYDANEKKPTKGALLEFLEHHIGPKMGAEFVWDKGPSSIARLCESLSNKSRDAVALLTYTPQRARDYVFTEAPYFVSSSGLAVLKNGKLKKVEKIDDILSLRIGYVDNAYLSPFMRDERLIFDNPASGNFNMKNFKKLMMNRIDAVYTPDMASLLAGMEQLDLEKDVNLIRLPEETSAFHVVFAKGMESVAGRYNEAFDEIDGRKLFMQLMSKYIDISKL